MSGGDGLNSETIRTGRLAGAPVRTEGPDGPRSPALLLLGQALVMETSGMTSKAEVLYVRVIMDYPETEAAIEAKKRSDFRFEQRVENAWKRAADGY